MIQGCFLEAGLSRGDLTEAEWRVLKGLLPIEPEKRGRGRPHWSEAGVWETIAVTLAEIIADSGHYSIDSTTVRAHVSAAGGKGGLIDALWPLAGRVHPSKLHCLTDALGRPLAFHLTVGEAADCKAHDSLIDLPERAPDALLADKGYDADAIRADLAKRNIEAVIPGRSNRRVKIEHNRALYKQRNCIERMFG